MKQFKKVLVPIDVSDQSRQILEYAFTFGAALDLELLVLHVVDARIMQPMPYSYDQVEEDYYTKLSRDDMIDEIKKAVQNEIDYGTTFEHQLKVTVLVRFGIPYDQIVKTAREEQVDFIVMGTRGHTKLEEIFLGGVATKVSRRADCPVFLIRPRKTLDR